VSIIKPRFADVVAVSSLPRTLVPLPLQTAGQSFKPAKGSSTFGPANRGRPIHLTATCVVSPSSSNSPNAQALHSPVSQPIEIWDIKFAFNVLIPGSSPNLLAMDGGSILAQLTLNDDMITNGYVPIWSFDESTNIVNEQTNGAVNTSGSTDETYNYGEFIWHLPRPLYLRPADQISVSFQNAGQTAVNAVCRVSLSGCVLNNTSDPATRAVPYAASYVSPPIVAEATVQTVQSAETDLENATDDPITLHKMTGRVDNYPTSGVGANNHFDDSVLAAGTSTDLGFTTSMQAYTGRGTQLIPYSVNIRDLFGPARSVPLCGILEPGDYVLVELAQSGTDAYGQVSVAVVGYREIPVR